MALAKNRLPCSFEIPENVLRFPNLEMRILDSLDRSRADIIAIEEKRPNSRKHFKTAFGEREQCKSYHDGQADKEE